MENKFSNFLDILYIVVKWRKFIIINFIVICVLAVLFSLIVPKWFTSTSTLMAPSEDGTGFNLSSVIGALPVSNLFSGGVSDEANRFIAIINSRTLMEEVAHKFDLQKRYKTKNVELTVKRLRKHVNAEINEEGTISISVKAKTKFWPTKTKDDDAKSLAQRMCSFIVERLDEYNIKLKGEKAGNTRQFIEKRYFQNLQDLAKAEDLFKEYQEKYGVIALEEQTIATINVASQLKGQVIAKEIELGILKNYFGDTNVEYKRVKNELNEYKKRYDQFKKGNQEYVFDENKKDLLLTINDIPELGVQYLRLFRDVKLQETILEFMLPQYEQAKIQEQKEIPTLQILDDANLPLKKSKPKRAIIVVFMGFLSIVISLLYVFSYEKLEYLKESDSEIYHKLVSISKLFGKKK